ncbi:EscI/YscI/HrpB family type III secretion system inner rod protein [Providencia rettgeri]|uniref:EscI/YscI/HrpB family type III secretion system inner rod protein n=1 Tax=Providencia rettgeri TaxID=587 RepID=UPI000D7E6DF3|nr:EscI/YscI/HrpB family type III secretion system inner rod protein [Providencia rettgeri]EMA4781806.1 EscI/YscI/HrpB family type III secretion system inner rod protein [Providencia rettgeri]
MNSPSLDGLGGIESSILKESYQNVGEGFKEILNNLSDINASGGNITVQDTLALQQAVFQYSMYQEMITKIASKSANAINEVMKAQ